MNTARDKVDSADRPNVELVEALYELDEKDVVAIREWSEKMLALPPRVMSRTVRTLYNAERTHAKITRVHDFIRENLDELSQRFMERLVAAVSI